MAYPCRDTVAETRLVLTGDAFAYIEAAQRMSGVLVQALLPRDDRHALLLATRHARQTSRLEYGGILGDPDSAHAFTTVPGTLMDEILPRLAGPQADSVLVEMRTYSDEFAGERFQQLQCLAEVALAGQVSPE